MPGFWKRHLTVRAAAAWRRPPLSPDTLRALRPRRILVVRQHNQMGDMVCATPCFRALKQTWPAAELGLVTAPVNGGVVAGNPHLARLFLFEQSLWRRPVALAALLRDLRRFDAELAFVLNSVSFSATSAFLALWSPARWVVGGDSAPFGSALAGAFSLRLPASPHLDRHAVAHSLAPLAAVGITTQDRSTVVVPSAAERREAAGLVTRLLAGRPFWALHPGAGKPQNCWPPERFAAVAGLAAQAGHAVLILHGPADRATLTAVAAALAADVPARAGRPAPIVTAPELSIGTGAAVLELADRLLCNDTGVMHVAGALRVPTLALFGSTDPGLWKPPAAEVRALRAKRRLPDGRGAEFGWLESLDIEAVWQAWRELSSRPSSPPRPT